MHQAHGPVHRAQFFCDEAHRPTWLGLPQPTNPSGCFYCNRTVRHKSRTKDHVIPTARGGSRLRHNVVLCCFKCNQLKGILTGEEYITLLPNGRKVVKEVQARMQNLYREGVNANRAPEGDIYVLIRTVLAQHHVTGNEADDIAKDLLRVVFSRIT